MERIPKNDNCDKKEKIEIVREKPSNNDDELFAPKMVEEDTKFDQKDGKNNLFASFGNRGKNYKSWVGFTYILIFNFN